MQITKRKSVFLQICKELFLIILLLSLLQLIRKFFNRSLVLLRSHDWEEEHIQHLVDILSGHVINSTIEDVPAGIKLHIVDIYLDELEKVGIGKVCWTPLVSPRHKRIHILLSDWWEWITYVTINAPSSCFFL